MVEVNVSIFLTVLVYKTAIWLETTIELGCCVHSIFCSVKLYDKVDVIHGCLLCQY